MARISLRAYNHEIENLIDRGQIEESIAHCKNIIKQFPKHIETYRLLGKAFLESQRYSEAADILQRVLSVFPDDFISQLGMSIIREDEGNLDASIWHMERAYEVQPFNRAVQDELRRLYGRRDGVEPPRIRLTRGALVRMYARGDLYPQAIAEIRAALAEDQKRVDLLVLLSRMYFLSGQKIEATEICSSLIAKLPYCYEANRILKDILPETSRADDARIFQQRLFALDPYAAFISPNSPTSSQVPEQTVMVEKVDWQPDMADAQSPDWARTIGVRWEDSPEEALPDWLNTIIPGEPLQEPGAAQGTAELAEPTAFAGDELIPDFLKEAGWHPSDGTAEEPSTGLVDEPAAATEEELADAEIPDWLKTLAPESIAGTPEEEPEDDKASLDWLSGIIPAGVGAAAAVAAITSDRDAEPESDVPVSEVETTDETSETPGIAETAVLAAGLVEVDQTLEGLEDQPLAAETGVEEQTSMEIQDLSSPILIGEQTPPEENLPYTVTERTEFYEPSELTNSALDDNQPLPDWMQQAQDEQPVETEAETQPAQDLPDWMKQLSDEPEVDAESIGQAEIAEITPTASEMELAEPEAVPPSATNIDEMDMDSAMAWMEALAAKQGAEEDSLKITSPEQRSEVTPEWIQRQSDSIFTEPVQEESIEAVSVPGAEIEAQTTHDVEESSLPAADEVVAEPFASIEEINQEAPAEINDIDSAMAWMEALAAKQGADEESLKITSPEARTETPPEWIAQQQEQPGDIESSSVDEGERETLADLSSDSDDLLTTGVKGALIFGAIQNGEVEEVPPIEGLTAPLSEEDIAQSIDETEQPITETWVSEVTVEPVVDEPELETQAVGSMDELPVDRLDSNEEFIASDQVIEPEENIIEPKVTSETEIPDWLRSYEEEQQRQEPVWQPGETFTPSSVSDEELPAWLSAETEDQTIPEIEHKDEAVIPAIPMDEIKAEADMPDWLKELKNDPQAKVTAETEPETDTTWVPEYNLGKPQEPAGISSTQAAPSASGDTLALARASLRSGDLDGAVAAYTDCINSNERLEDVIEDLKTAVDQHPVDVSVWQVLGDAYMRNDHIQDALDAYTKAEELLR